MEGENSGDNKSIGPKSQEISVLLLQFKPVFKNPEESMKKASELISKYSKEHKIDIVLLPEMAFTGYDFNSKEEIDPFLEMNNSGATYEWCKEQAKRLEAYVCCGYPERVNMGNMENMENREEFKRYNSLLIVSATGGIFHNYRKHFLFTKDENWASEGPAFCTLPLPLKSGRIINTGVCICMDIDPYQFKADYNLYECATYFQTQQVELVLFPTNWSMNKDLKEQYWINRMFPLTTDGGGNNRCVFLACNRVGVEGGANYFGRSCVVQLNPVKETLLRLDDLEENSLFLNFDI